MLYRITLKLATYVLPSPCIDCINMTSLSAGFHVICVHQF